MHTQIALALVCLLLADFPYAHGNSIGINYGRLGNNLPSPAESVALLTSMGASWVKLYDANSSVLNLLSGQNIRVSIMVPNEQISNIAKNKTTADEWVRQNVLAYPRTQIRIILVGNEVLSTNDYNMWFDLIPAMQNIKNFLSEQNIHNIKVGTPLAMDMLETTFPPSSGKFKPVIAQLVLSSLLKFISGTSSYFFIDVYPYFPWSSNPNTINLNFSLFESVNLTYKDPESGLIYTNLLDQMIDSVVFAIKKLGYYNINMAIAETGWPNEGDIDQPGANTYNAAIYNRNVVRRMTSYPPIGTPAMPGVEIPTFLFSLYNENQKPGPGSERHWGLLNPDGTPIFEVDLTGKRLNSEYAPLARPTNNMPYGGNIWCVVGLIGGLRLFDLAPELDWACSQGNGTCDELAPGRSCYEPVSVISHASYAFSSYWAKYRSKGASCYFNGLAIQTTQDPSHGNCHYPSVKI